MMFFKTLKLLNWFSAQCRKALYNMAFSSRFKYFGKRTKLDISGVVSIGKNIYIGDDVAIIVEKGATLCIGDHSFIGESCYIKCFGGKIEIGQNVSNHKFDDPEVLVKDHITKQGIQIGENIWFGARVTVLDGVNIANNVVVGACSLVSKSLPEAGVYVGTPAKKIK